MPAKAILIVHAITKILRLTFPLLDKFSVYNAPGLQWGLRPFEPLFASPHLQTIAGRFWPRPSGASRFPVESRIYRTEPGVQVLVKTQRPQGTARGEILLVHGLEGSSEAPYMRGVSYQALRAGFVTHRLNLRTCGGTEHLCSTLYHSGLTTDLPIILRELERDGRTPVWLAGFSLGANLILKLAGELGEDAQRLVAGLCAVSAPLDLAVCAHRLHQRDNFFYEQRFLRHMRARLLATGRYRPSDFTGIRSIVELDDRITAPAFGFRDAAQYYATQSSNQFLDRIRVPSLLIHAEDDTFIPAEVYRHPALARNPCLRLLATTHGGHLGFLARRAPRLWLDHTVVEWVMEAAGTKQMSPASSP